MTDSAMFDCRLASKVYAITESTIHFSDGSSAPLLNELSGLANLTPEWQNPGQLANKGLLPWQLARLTAAGIVECGRDDTVFPWRARQYYERQFPERAQALPFTDWLARPAPRLVWLGLPHSNLSSLRHSAATGLAAVVDALPVYAPVLGVLPEAAPNERCAMNMKAMARLAAACGFRLGVLGGDHCAAWSLLSVLKSGCGVESVRYIHIDAHHDLYGIDEKGKPSGIYHSNFLANLLERHHVDQVRLFGCRDRGDPVLHSQRQGYDVKWISSPEELGRCTMYAHTHLSIDIDVLDPARFVGVSSPLSDGWSLEELVTAVRGVTSVVPVDSVSIVEAGSDCLDTIQAVVELTRILEGL